MKKSTMKNPPPRGLDDPNKTPGVVAAKAEARRLVAVVRREQEAEKRRAAASGRQVQRLIQGKTIHR